MDDAKEVMLVSNSIRTKSIEGTRKGASVQKNQPSSDLADVSVPEAQEQSTPQSEQEPKDPNRKVTQKDADIAAQMEIAAPELDTFFVVQDQRNRKEFGKLAP